MKFEIKPKAILDGFSNLAKKQVVAAKTRTKHSQCPIKKW